MEVVSGDCLVVKDLSSGAERRLQLSRFAQLLCMRMCARALSDESRLCAALQRPGALGCIMRMMRMDASVPGAWGEGRR